MAAILPVSESTIQSESIATQTSFLQRQRSYCETPGVAEDTKVFASLKDLEKDQRRQLYERFGLWEKGYTLGVLSYTTNIVLLMRFPEYYWCWHLIKAFIFLPWRWIRFRKRNMEWLMVDFCYFNTYLTVFGCLAALIRITTGFATPLHRFNYELIRGGFAFANGALVLSVPMFGNKLVFHEIDNTTSLYIHLSPALLMWTLRWGGGYGTSRIEEAWPNMFDVCHDMRSGDEAVANIVNMLWSKGSCEGTASDFLVYPAICWMIGWGVPYYILVFCVMSGWLKRNNKETLFTYTIDDPTGNGRFIVKLPESLQPLGYMLQHFVYSVATGFLSIVLWNSFALHTLFLAGIALLGVHNGSTFMFRVVAAKEVQSIVKEVASSSQGASSGGYALVNEKTQDA
mmetsp:Transcript_86106/g.191809  ORF Transcript_86106/g.191809 Transcript_86106/m.191809 type:complete len:399 (-) Transcript_86106:90-1286(-)